MGSKDSTICRVAKAGILYEFRIEGYNVERRILNDDKTSIDKVVSEWRVVSQTFIEIMKSEHPELKTWLRKNRSALQPNLSSKLL